jgi:hypothetical protein
LEHSNIQQNFLTSGTNNLLANSNSNVELTPSSFLFLNDSSTSSNSTGYYDFGISSSNNSCGSSASNNNSLINFQSSASNDHQFVSQILSKNDPFMNLGLSPLVTSSGGIVSNTTSSLVTSPFGVGYASSLSSGSCNSSTDSSAASSHNDIVLNSIFQHEQHLASNGKYILNDSSLSATSSSSSSTSSSFHNNFHHNQIHELSNFYYAQNQPNNIDAN